VKADPSTPDRPRRRLGRRARRLGTLAIGLGSIGALVWVAPPSQVIKTVTHLNPWWLAGAVGLEVASCLSYVVLFRRFFPEPPRRVGRRVAWIAMGAGALLPGGNFSSAAATGLLLRHQHSGARGLVERCGALLCFLTLFGFAVNGVAGVLLLLGIGHGPHDLVHAGIPVLVSLFVIGSATAAMLLGGRLGARAPRPVRAVVESLEGARDSLFAPHWRLLGAAGFLCLDMGALWAACRATGHPLGVLALALAYFVGYLATMIPMPAGIGVLDSGLAGALVLYGFAPAASVGSVLAYHAISIWVPCVGGLIAWISTRGASRKAPAAGTLVEPPVSAPAVIG
jgi:uncharacterized membrane protein YbhN (UPF0104 family)